MRDANTGDPATHLLREEPAVCLDCGQSFLRRHPRRLYCSPNCRWRASRRRRAANGLPVRGCAGCRARDAEIARLRKSLQHGSASS